MVMGGRRSRFGCLVIATMITMSSMAENVEEWTRKEEQEREVTVEMCPVLGDEKETDDDEEAEEGDIETAHCKRGKESEGSDSENP